MALRSQIKCEHQGLCYIVNVLNRCESEYYAIVSR